MAQAPFPLPDWSPFWDPRPAKEAAKAPIARTRNLPLEELNSRTAELPPRHVEVLIVAEEPLVSAAYQALHSLERSGRIVPTEESGATAPVAETRLWKPNAFLDAAMPALASGRPGAALDLGCGSGREALLMASWGWQVEAIDVLPDALEIAKRLELRYAHQDAPKVRWRCLDIESKEPELGTGYGLITCFRYLNRRLLARVAAMLDPGGSFVMETFTEVHRERFGKPRREEFVLKIGEAPDLVPGLEVVAFEEGLHEGSHTARLWARKC